MNYAELAHLGLSEKEAKVYLAALELGKSSVQNLSKKAEVNRATTYVIIESLMKKGLMSSLEENKKQFFHAEPPEKLRLLFESMETEIIRKLDYLDKMLPELKALSGAHKKKPAVRYFEGKDGLRAMAEELFSSESAEEARMIYSQDLLDGAFSKHGQNGLSPRSAKGRRARAIINDEHDSLKSSDLENIRIPANEYPITSDVAFFGDKIGISTQKGGLIGLIIENREISNTLKIIFDLAWKYLERKYKTRET